MNTRTCNKQVFGNIETGLPRPGKKVWKMVFFQVREFWFESVKLTNKNRKGKVREFQIFPKSDGPW